jgi:uncharacterized small protein (DUF1192 family)
LNDDDELDRDDLDNTFDDERPTDIDDDFADELAEGVQDEVPVWGRVRRVYRIFEKRVTKPYRREISRLKKNQQTLLTTIENQNKNIGLLREVIADLEAQLEARGAKEK